MIGRLQGILLEKTDSEVLVDVGGLAYEVDVPASTYFELPETGHAVLLHTHFVVREDAQQLYGFIDRQDRSLFRLLIKVNGVGPKLALGILSSMGSGQFVACVLKDDVNALVKLPGIGRKTAERLLIDMRDRLKDWTISAEDKAAAGSAPVAKDKDALQEAEAALLSLGYKPQEASRAVMNAVSAMETDDTPPATEQIIRMALKQLSKA